MQIVTLQDQGQDYLSFGIRDRIIIWSRPNLKPGWYGTVVTNKQIVPHGTLGITLHKGYQTTLTQPITTIQSQ